jgi:hypothetical protein
MKIKQILFSSLILVCFQCCRQAATPVKIGKILFAGKSITEHGVAPNMDWLMTCSIAACAKEKDYAHLVISAIATVAGKSSEAMVQNVANYERDYETYDLTNERKELFTFKADVVILAIGQNVPNLGTSEAKAKFKASALKMIGALKDSNNPVILVRSCFYGNATKDEVLKQACQEAGGIFVDISSICKDESIYAHS